MCLGIYVIRSLTRYRVGVLVGGQQVGTWPGLGCTLFSGQVQVVRPPIQVTVVWPECQSGQEGGADNTKVLKKNKFSQVVLSGAGQVTVWPER